MKLLLKLFLAFLQVGLFSFGGGYAAVPLIKSHIVEQYGWLSMSEFTDLITIAEMTPGPIIVNSATFVGLRIAGLPGAIIATLGSIFPSLIIVSVLAWLYFKFKNLSVVNSVLAYLRPVVVALIASAGVSIFLQVCFEGAAFTSENINYTGLILGFTAFFALRKYKCNPIIVMVACGVINLIIGSVILK